METVLSLFKSYFILMLLLLVLSYLAPKDSYKKYFQFFIGVWMCVLLIRPVVQWLDKGEKIVFSNKEAIEERLEDVEQWQGDGVDIFELFILDRETE